MGEDATFQDPNDSTKTVSEGMSQLDIVKHAVKTIMHTLTDHDRVSLVTFDSRASIEFPLTTMTRDGLTRGVTAVEMLKPGGSTNIWAGLHQGLESLRTAPPVPAVGGQVGSGVRKRSVLLLTDGQPTDSPPKGEEESLRSYFETYPDFTCQVNTFGFGYSLKSKLLADISRRGNGTFSFIPDAKIVGTCFVNATANACSNLSQNCNVHISLKGGANFAGDLEGDIPFEKTEWGVVAKLGPIQYGQGRDLVIPIDIPPARYGDDEYLEVVVEYESAIDGAHKISATATSRKTTPDAISAFLRNHVVTTITNVIRLCESGRGQEGVRNLKALVGKVASYEAVGADPRLKGLNEDVSGRVSKAISTVERWRRWGQHYLRAVVRAHQLQLRTNFMDPGLQVYGGEFFKKLEARGGEIFCALPMKKTADYDRPTTTTITANTTAARQQQQQLRAAPIVAPLPVSVPAPAPAPAAVPDPLPVVDNYTYYGGGGGGCFDASCTVKVLKKGGEVVTVRMDHVKKGDLVEVDSGEDGVVRYARVRCVVEIERKVQDDLVEFLECGLTLTKKHPIRIPGNSNYEFPIDLLAHERVVLSPASTSVVYNFLLENTHVLLVNGVGCPTFGHGIKDPVTWHYFYATERVVKVVEELKGFSQGLVRVEGSLRRMEKKEMEREKEEIEKPLAVISCCS